MSNDKQAAKSISTGTYVLVAVLAVITGFIGVYVNLGGDGNDQVSSKLTKPDSKPVVESASKTENSDTKPAPQGLAGLNVGQMTTFVVREEPQDIAEVTFVDVNNRPRNLNEWKGKTVLLNLWATWCAPCRKEMPDLDELKAKLGQDGRFDVVAVSIDRGGLDKPRKFLDDIAVKNLELFNNSGGKLGSDLKAFGMPTTLLLDPNGKEIGRLVGPADWKSEDAVRLIKAAIEANS